MNIPWDFVIAGVLFWVIVTPFLVTKDLRRNNENKG